MTVKYSVTFEFEERAPVTHRGTVGGGTASVCLSRATRRAQQALKPVNWSSVVAVLLERVAEDARAVVAPVPESANP